MKVLLIVPAYNEEENIVREYTKIKQKDADGNEIGQRTASKMRFRLNLLNIRIGVTVHLWNKKANKA